MINEKKLYKILNKVDKPARYIGLEKNSIKKDFEKQDVNFCFCFPDVYEIGMSHLGLQIIYFLTNSIKGFNCERAFSPWEDMEKLMLKEEIPLYSLENKRPINEFDIVGFTLQYELSYTNILNMLKLGNIPLTSDERTEEDPLIIAGGTGAYNPEPIYNIIDLFIMGEAEKVNLKLFSLYRDCKNKGYTKLEFLKEASKMDGIYVPMFYDIEYNEDKTIKRRNKKYEYAKDIIKRQVVQDFENTFHLEKQIVPYIDIVHNRATSEIFRACTQGCRFCQAGMVYRPIRERSVDNILNIIEEDIKNTGYNEVGFSSLSTGDYSNIVELVDKFIERFADRNIGISLPSLRLDSQSFEILEKIGDLRKSSITFAPEAGSQRLRDVINKKISRNDLDYAINKAIESGYSTIKLYFMIGLPTEEKEDLDGIREILYRVKDIYMDSSSKSGRLQINTSIASFVPKPFTPFQWYGQNSLEMFNEKKEYLWNSVNDKSIKMSFHDSKSSRIEALISKGDRRVSKAIIKAFEMGQRFDSWDEYFNYETWQEACKKTGVDIDFYVTRQRSYEEILPWDFVDVGISKKFLIRENELSKSEIITNDCRKACKACGVNIEICKGELCP